MRRDTGQKVPRADVREEVCSRSTPKEANSRGKVDTAFAQMVYTKATSGLPLLASYAYGQGRRRCGLSASFGKR